ncbi:MAG TPA: hypothetical protein DD420_33215 [Streptomyces sp.]|nr:hypothetical protein [Streptomyces sp.]
MDRGGRGAGPRCGDRRDHGRDGEALHLRDRERPTAGRTNTWSGGFQGEVTVRNDGSSALTGWAVGLNLAPGRSISSLCNGAHTGTGGLVTVRNALERPDGARRDRRLRLHRHGQLHPGPLGPHLHRQLSPPRRVRPARADAPRTSCPGP